ncbi:RabGAP/TBC [Rickenella mellea]|uniref:RabGAP/TBC n=1 Tax=Rickenella mellea TaxID=50990 RepID=A0A4Y7QL16_9AGAM|nr:RabGAP/TBC [Rickenella mellea]
MTEISHTGKNVQEVVLERESRITTFTTDDDDAFSEGGDDARFEFNSTAIREELERNFRTRHEHTEEGEGESSTHANNSQDPDASVSSLDIDGSDNSSQSTQGSHPRLNDIQNSNLEDVSLSPPVSAHHEASLAIPPVTVVKDADRASAHISTTSEIPPTSPTRPVSTPPIPPSKTPASDGEPDAPPSPGSRQAQETPMHRPTRSFGPSALEKVISKTRPSFLPPKPKDEDNRHLADWEKMMKLSRLAEEKRRKALQERRLAREKEVESSTEIWEKEVLPDWRHAVKTPRLRQLWWNGIPPKLRSQLWEKALGNALALSKDTYRTCVARAKRALSTNSFPTTMLNLIEEDIGTTLPDLRLFLPNTGPLHQDLKDLLCAWVVSRSDEGLGYVTGASKIAAMFLLNMNPPAAFLCMRNLLERHCMRSFYGGLSAKEDVEAYYRIFDTLLADGMPKIYFNFKQHQISPVAYLPDWILPVFLDHLPLEACARIWDVLILEGDSFLFRAALAMLGVLEPRLFFPDRTELLGILRGENKAALEVAKRDSLALEGGKYAIYGIDEEVLWERIIELEDWWKDSTWARLIQRELPDL